MRRAVTSNSALPAPGDTDSTQPQPVPSRPRQDPAQPEPVPSQPQPAPARSQPAPAQPQPAPARSQPVPPRSQSAPAPSRQDVAGVHRLRHVRYAPWPYARLDVAAARAAGHRPHPIRQFVLKTRSRCNLACTYCYVYEMADQGWRGQPP
ncbi:hypothetical protein AB0B44_43910, partial [Streptomyces sp. NPDC041003]